MSNLGGVGFVVGASKSKNRKQFSKPNSELGPNGYRSDCDRELVIGHSHSSLILLFSL